MKWLLGSFVTSIVAFFVLQSIDDAKQDRNGLPRATAGKKVATFFFVSVLCVIAFYWFAAGGGESAHNATGGGAMPRPAVGQPPRMDKNLLETHMIKNIREDIQVGPAPF